MTEQDSLLIIDTMSKVISVLMLLEKDMIILRKGLEQEIIQALIRYAIKQWLVLFNKLVEMEVQ